MPKKCENCGNQNINSANFCEKCGITLKDTDNRSNNATINKPKKSIFKKLPLIAWIIIAIIIFGGIIVAFESISPPLGKYDDNGITFNYIKGWSFNEGTSGNELLNGSYEGVILTVYKRPATSTLEESAALNLEVNEIVGMTDKGFLKIDGNDAYQVTSSSGGISVKTYLFIKNGYEYKLMFAGDTFNYRRSIDTIVNSFHVKV